MSILFGILLYVLCIAFLCTLTGINRLDESEPRPHLARDHALSKPTSAPGRVPVREAHG
ncbi:MAG TPA: hypothetical protein VII72_14210 [Myxococcota bacterium]|jgi:hypothetical protein